MSGSADPGPAGSIAGSVLPLRRAEELIATLPGVLSVRIVPGPSGAIDAVHVLTTDAVPPKATVRNIESALMAQLGLRVNHRKISIATTLDVPRAADAPEAASGSGGPALVVEVPLRAPLFEVPVEPPGPPPGGSGAGAPFRAVPGSAAAAPAPPPPADASTRAGAPHGTPGRDGTVTRGGPIAAEGRRLIVFDDVEVHRSRTKGVLCRVTLQRDGERFVGESEGQETERSRVELAARATVAAIAQAVRPGSGGDRALALEGAKLLDAFDRQFVFVCVAARIGRELVALTGSCEVRESAETSAALSVLDATNRWVNLER